MHYRSAAVILIPYAWQASRVSHHYMRKRSWRTTLYVSTGGGGKPNARRGVCAESPRRWKQNSSERKIATRSSSATMTLWLFGYCTRIEVLCAVCLLRRRDKMATTSFVRVSISSYEFGFIKQNCATQVAAYFDAFSLVSKLSSRILSLVALM